MTAAELLKNLATAIAADPTAAMLPVIICVGPSERGGQLTRVIDDTTNLKLYCPEPEA